MNNKANYKKGNRMEILKALYANSCIPYRSLRLLQGEVKLTQRMVKKMEKEGLLAVCRSEHGNGKIIKLKDDWQKTMKEYQEYLPNEYVDRYKKVREEASKSKESRGREERLLKNAEASLLMHRSGVGTYPDNREGIDKYMTMLGQGRSQYYSSVEIKNQESYRDKVELDKDGRKKVTSSRINGLLVSPGGNYAVYNITNHLIEWEKFGELKIVHHIEKVLAVNVNSKQQPNNTSTTRLIDCLLVANDMEMFERVLTNENNKRRSTTLLNIDYAYENMYAIPTDKNGIEMLKLMQKENWKMKMEYLLLSNCEKDAENFSIVHDGYNEEDGYILLFCTSNLSKLKMFLKRATNARDSEKFCIYCFTYQLPLFQKLRLELGSISIKAMELTDYIEMERGVV